MGERVRAVLISGLVAVLVWLFAESEGLKDATLRVEVAFVTDPQSGRVIDVVDKEWRQPVAVRIRGTSSAVSVLEASLKRIELAPGAPGVPASSGDLVITLAEAIRGNSEFAGAQISVIETDPVSVKVRVDQLVTRDMPVVIDAPGAELEGPAESKPASVRVTMTKSLADVVNSDQAIRATITPESLAKLVPGRRETVTAVVLRLPPALAGASRVMLEPAQVDAVLTVRSRTGELVLPSVPVQIRVAASEIGLWDITIPEEDRFLADVRISGPSELVDRVRRGEIKVVATVSLTLEELERGIALKEAQFVDLPEQLRAAADRREIGLKIVRR